MKNQPSLKEYLAMIEKVSHVKNPLTVIAVFATLAEVSGTVVLPLIQPSTQSVFVWFLMLFPTLLVISFFGTLLFKPHSLYAPSDYKDESIFASFFQPASIEARHRKLDEEVAGEIDAMVQKEPDAFALNSDASVNGAKAAPAVPENGPVDTRAIQPNKPVSPPPTQDDRDISLPAPNISGPISRMREELYRTALFAEHAIINYLSDQMSLSFAQGVSFNNDRRFEFDAVSTNPDRVVVVEVKFTRIGSIPAQSIRKRIDQVTKLYYSLSDSSKKNFELVYAVVVDGVDEETMAKLKTQIRTVAKDAPFRVRPEVKTLASLSEFSVG